MHSTQTKEIAMITKNCLQKAQMLKETEITGKKCIKNKISEMENYGPHHRLYAKIILKSTTFNPTLLENRRGTQG